MECPRCGNERESLQSECRPCMNAYRRRYHEKHKIKISDRDKPKRQSAEYKEQSRQRTRDRYKWMSEGDATREQLQEIYERDGGCCIYCGTEVIKVRFKAREPIGFDHRIPRSKGGQNTASNIDTCCSLCNRKKADKLPEEFKEALRMDTNMEGLR